MKTLQKSYIVGRKVSNPGVRKGKPNPQYPKPEQFSIFIVEREMN